MTTISERFRKESLAYMSKFNEELWKLGISAKTQHNEVAPAQHEIAPIYDQNNVATDHNQLVMETAQRIADEQGLKCLLHEKPFAGINGSGKHNNWSMTTDDRRKPAGSGQNSSRKYAVPSLPGSGSARCG